MSTNYNPNIHDVDAGIGFDMRNVQVYADSDDEDDEIERRSRPRSYKKESDEACNCCLIIVILIILAVGSFIGYSIGSELFSPPTDNFDVETLPPDKDVHASYNNNPYHTPQPTKKDPFHLLKNQRNHKKKDSETTTTTSTTTTTTPQPTKPPKKKNKKDQPIAPVPSPKAATTKAPFEPSAVREPFEPSAVEEKIREPSPVTTSPPKKRNKDKKQDTEPTDVKEKPLEPVPGDALPAKQDTDTNTNDVEEKKVESSPKPATTTQKKPVEPPAVEEKIREPSPVTTAPPKKKNKDKKQDTDVQLEVVDETDNKLVESPLITSPKMEEKKQDTEPTDAEQKLLEPAPVTQLPTKQVSDTNINDVEEKQAESGPKLASTSPPGPKKQNKDDVAYVESPNFDLNRVQKDIASKQYNLYFDDKMLSMDSSSTELGESSILTKIVLDNYEIPYIFEHAHLFNVKYPNSGKSYDVNQYRRWCFYSYLFDTSSSLSAQIDLTWNKFKVENGYDRILIRHFNQSFMDPPFVIAGRGDYDDQNKINDYILPQKKTYHLRSNEFKTICVEMETDDSINLAGIDFNVQIRYDDCSWSDYTDCLIPDEHLKYWGRGPWYDGLCGIGVHRRTRLSKDNENPSAAFVKCINDDITSSFNTDIDGPDYCLKASCETIDNDNNPNGIPESIRYGWGDHKTFYNGIGGLDATYPDLIRILTANPSTPTVFDTTNDVKQYMTSSSFVALYQSYPFYNVNPNGHDFNLDDILIKLEDKKKEILSEHANEKLLTSSVLKVENIKQTLEWLGARLTHSLIIGRPFTMIFTGSSNTAGHDNQFASTYSMQLQARLRAFWSQIGVDGAAMNVRNEAVGGAPNTQSMAWHIHARVSETVGYPFNDMNVLKTKALRRYEDVIFWESFMNDGGNPKGISFEEQLRNTALLNAIFGAMNSISEPQKCEPKYARMPKPKTHLKDILASFSKNYGKSMGIIEMDFNGEIFGKVCDQDKYKKLKINWHPNAKGHRVEADIYAYTLLNAVIDFINKYKDDINSMKIDQSVSTLDDWLIEKSGNWAQSYMESVAIADKKEAFPKPLFCKPFCDKTVAPFVLKTHEPNDWDTGFRLQDYIVYDYDNIHVNGTFVTHELKEAELPTNERFYEPKEFSVNRLLWSTGWEWIDPDRDPPHYPQDKTGKIGSMDRKRVFTPKKSFWYIKFGEFLKDFGVSNEELAIWSKDTRNPNKPCKPKDCKDLLSKYAKDFGQYVLKKNYDIKFEFMVPQIGNHSILFFVAEKGTKLYGHYTEKEKNFAPVYGANIERKDGKTKDDLYNYDYSKLLIENRKCTLYPEQPGCIFHHIAPGKYFLRFYPMNITFDQWNEPFVQIIAF